MGSTREACSSLVSLRAPPPHVVSPCPLPLVVRCVCDVSYSSSSPTLSSFTAVSGPSQSDGFENRVGFSVNVLAAPFDGVGVAVALGGYDPTTLTYQNDVWTYSLAGTFPSGATPSHWYHNTLVAPWSPRASHSTTTDAERLVLILTGGTNGAQTFNDVWQMSFDTGAGTPTAPASILWYRLTAQPGYAPRRDAALYTVHDWLFVYGGAQGASPFLTTGDYDDVWMSADYGSTWTEWPTTGTGSGRFGVTGYSESRRLFVLGGAMVNGAVEVGPTFSNQVYVAYW